MNKLEYNERNVRAGKAVGLPYQGSKKRISKKIAAIIAENFGKERPVYDLFGGGAAVALECVIAGFNKVIYNELDPGTVKSLKYVLTATHEDIAALMISRHEFQKIKHKIECGAKLSTTDELKLLINSFSNNRGSYLYGKETADIKYELGQAVYAETGSFDNYKQSKTFKAATDTSQFERARLQQFQCAQQLERVSRLEQFERVNQLQQFQQLQQLTRVNQLEQFQRAQQLDRMRSGSALKIRNKSYTRFSHLKNAIIYLDPPYENSDVKGYRGPKFDSQALYDWCVEMTKRGNVVLLSSYRVSDPRFEMVHEFSSVRAIVNNGNNSDAQNCERLFMVKTDEEKPARVRRRRKSRNRKRG